MMRGRRPLALAGLVAVLATGLVLATAGVANFRGGTYRGTTSQDELVLFQVKKRTHKIEGFFDYNAPPCASGTFHFSTRIRRTGRFVYADEFYGFIRGKLEGRRGAGTAQYSVETAGCDSGVLDWTAKKTS